LYQTGIASKWIIKKDKVMEIVREHPEIKGWGTDADSKNDPTYPMKNRTDEEQKGYTWQRPAQQPETVEILRSVERPNLSAVFGTSTPPAGLSGMVRRFAFKYSEGRFAHWIPLILADRINVIEGIIDDISKGKFPNTFVEKGGKARWKFDKLSLIRNWSLALLTITGVAAFLFKKRINSNLNQFSDSLPLL
jgi:hypothetical protein